MSNPAVIKLQQKNIGKSRVWLDDNFGESIHIHIDDIRADLSNTEFDDICDDIASAINNLVQIEGFDCHNIDPIYLEVMLWKDLLRLQSVKMDKINLCNLLAPGRNGIAPLPSSRAVRALKGDTNENDGKRLSHHMGEDSAQRLDRMKKSIQEHGYPYNNHYIILYGNDNIIRDGQHRAACLYDLYGDIEVPVMRLYFEDYKAEKEKVSHNPIIIIGRKVKKRLRGINSIKDFYKTIRKYGHKIKQAQRGRKINKCYKENVAQLEKAYRAFAVK